MKKLFITALVIFALLIPAFIFANNYYANKNNKPTVLQTEVKKTDSDRTIKLPNDITNEVFIDVKKEIVRKPLSLSVPPANLPSKFNFFWEVMSGNKIFNNFYRGYDISFPNADKFTDVKGVTCFRGNNYRNSASFGFAEVTQAKLQKVWSINIGYIDEWTGVGWTGQPAIIKWDEKTKNIMNISVDKKKKTDLKEVIYSTMDGKIYFLDLDNGEATRPTINIGASHKGSVTIDPRGYPLLYAGQGINTAFGKPVETGYRIFNLINQKIMYFINGYDPFALRSWGAFDSNTMIDKNTDSLIECSENGIFYTAKLNTVYNPDKGEISINPELVRYRYHSPKNSTIGSENSVAIYRNFAYFSDNSGTLQCVDLNSMSPVWIRNVTDDSDSSINIEEISDSEVSLYTACEVDLQGTNGSSFVRKINALTGDLIWEKSYKCGYDAHTNGGALATPVFGKNEIDNLIIYNIAKTKGLNGSKLIAFDKKTGKEVWVIDLVNYCWSSPVDIYSKEGKSYIIQCDSIGNMFLLEGKTGKVLDKISLDSNIEGSPAVFDDMLVVGTRGQKIIGVKIK